MSQCLLLSFRCGMCFFFFFSVFISFFFLSVNFPAEMWLVDLQMCRNAYQNTGSPCAASLGT
ncbi:hypothetical protein Nmel_013102 [Mimus melanotis]